MTWFITNLMAALLLPPLNLLFLFGLGLWCWKYYPKIARFLLTGTFGLLWLFSTPYIADGALHLLENTTSPLNSPLPKAEAVVILGCGSYFHAPEYAAQDTVSDDTLVRLRYGVRLHRSTQLPILVTGGTPLGNRISEATQMQRVLEQDFQVPVQWIEGNANNTAENASYSFQILAKQGINKIYLVTHAWHIPRAKAAFERTGFEVIAAPTAFTTRYETDLLSFIPNTEALYHSKIFFHEAIGLVWYWLKS